MNESMPRKSFGICRLCDHETVLGKSHIIPAAFFRKARSESCAPILVTNAEPTTPKRVPNGIYDAGILCHGCEARFSALDQYGIEALLTRFDEQFLPQHGQGNVVAYQSVATEASRILGFLASVLWRASVSVHPFFSKVNLGRYEDLTRQWLTEGNADPPPIFDAVLSKWILNGSEGQEDSWMLNPHRERWDHGVNAYRVYFGHLVAYIKVDQRQFAQPFSAVSLRRAPPVTIIARRLADSKDFRALRQAAQSAEVMRRAFLSGRV